MSDDIKQPAQMQRAMMFEGPMKDAPSGAWVGKIAPNQVIPYTPSDVYDKPNILDPRYQALLFAMGMPFRSLQRGSHDPLLDFFQNMYLEMTGAAGGPA